MNLLIDIVSWGLVWLLVGMVVSAVLLWWGSRDEPPLEDEPEGELIRVNFSGRGRAA